MQVRPGPGVERLRGVAIIGQPIQLGRLLGQRFGKHAEVIERGQLVGDHAAVVVVAVHLQGVHAQRVFGRHRVAERALGPAGEVVGLHPRAAGGLGVGDFKPPVHAGGGGQLGVGLLVVPDVGVTKPVLIAVLLRALKLLLVQQPSLEPAAAGRVAWLQLERECLHEHRFIREPPTGRRAGGGLRVGDRVELDLRHAGQSDEALFRRSVGPKL